MDKESKIVQEVLDRIEKENIEPKAKWRFVLEHSLLWVPGVLATVLGGFAFSVLLFEVSHAGWRYWGITHRSLGSFLLDSLPYLWIFILSVFILAATWRFRKTDKGYKYNPIVLTATSILVSIVLGVFGHFVGVGEKIEKKIALLSVYKGIEAKQMNIWEKPEDGRMIGQIVFAGDDAYLVEPDGEKWDLVFEQPDLMELPFVKDENGVRLVGYVSAPQVFNVCLILPEFDPYKKGRDPQMPRPPRFGFESERKLPKARINQCSDLGHSLQFYKFNLKQKNEYQRHIEK